MRVKVREPRVAAIIKSRQYSALKCRLNQESVEKIS
jgi:hypothetical protein